MHARSRRASRAVVLSALASALVACGGEAPSSEAPEAAGDTPSDASSEQPAAPDTDATRTIDSSYGPVEVPTDAERVVVLDGAMLGYLVPLGVQPVGVADSADAPTVPAEYADMVDYTSEDVPNVGPDFEPDYEAIASVRPDLIVSLGGPEQGFSIGEPELLGEIAPTVFLPENDYDLDRPGLDLFRDNQRWFGELFGLEEEAEQAIADLDARIAELAADVPDGATATFVQAFSDGQIRFDGPVGFGGGVLHELGFAQPQPVLDLLRSEDGEGWRAVVSGERADIAEADVVVLRTTGSQVTSLEETIATVPLFGELPAVQEDRVAVVDNRTWFLRSVAGAQVVLDQAEAEVLPLLP